jgi:DNA-binding phage protein
MAILTKKQIRRRPRSAKRQIESLNDEERRNVRRALHWLRAVHGHDELARAMGISPAMLYKAGTPSRKQTPRLALVLSRIAGVAVGDVISGAWPVAAYPRPRVKVAIPEACPHCGRR